MVSVSVKTQYCIIEADHFPTMCRCDMELMLYCRVAVDVEAANETQPCHTSVDLPEVGAAEQEHLSSLSIFLILCVLGKCNHYL